MKSIGIKNENEFSLLLDTLSSDVGYAHYHYKLLRALQAAHEQHPNVFVQARTFWHLTLQAHNDAMLFRLARVLDRTKDAFSLGAWLATIKSHLHFFDEANFRARLSGNAFVDSLASAPRKPDEAELDRDIGLVGKDKVATKFIRIRNKYLSHQDPKVLLPSCGPEKIEDLSWDDVEHLLDLASGLLNKYSNLFAASLYSTSMAGQDDYKYVIETIKRRIESHEAAVAADMKKYLVESGEDPAT